MSVFVRKMGTPAVCVIGSKPETAKSAQITVETKGTKGTKEVKEVASFVR
jgi:hypothetical protein